MDARYGFVPADEGDGWLVRPAGLDDHFIHIFGEVRVRVEGPATARIRVTPEKRHRNLLGTVHGGFLLALVDQSLFVGPEALGIDGAMNGVTIDCATQFIAPARIGTPLDAVVEVLRETGRMIFLRGLIEQDGARALAYSGTTRKIPAA